MTFSHSQISQYLRCPKAYRYRYLEGWQDKGDRASLVFGRAFEKGLSAFFAGTDSSAAFFDEWSTHRDAGLEFGRGDSWESHVAAGNSAA